MWIGRWIVGAVVLAGLVLLIVVLGPELTLPSGAAHVPYVSRGVYIILLASGLALWRLVFGPTAADRIVAIDIFGILIVGLCALLCVASGRSWYIDIGIAWALQSFIGALALAKYLEGRALDE